MIAYQTLAKRQIVKKPYPARRRQKVRPAAYIEVLKGLSFCLEHSDMRFSNDLKGSRQKTGALHTT